VDTWESAIQQALACDDEKQATARREAVAPHTWQARVETLSGFLLEALS
jgi:hypothetical protein